MTPPRPIRLAYFVSHPIQYQAPLLRHIAADPDIDLTVHFTSDISVRGFHDTGFGVNVTWDVPLLDGYKYEFLPKLLFKGAHHHRQVSGGILRRLRQGKFDAAWLHGYSSSDSLQALFFCKLLSIPVLLRSDSNLYDRDRSRLKLGVKRVFFGALRHCVAGILACGTANHEYWQHYLGHDFPIFDMPYAVDNDFFQRRCREAAPRREQLRAELGLDPGRPVLLFASKLQARKCCLDLVRAFLRMSTLTPDSPSPYLLIVGDGEERPEIERLTAGNPDVRLLGFRNQSELPAFFDLCDLFILPSIHEPWGLVINEAMNAGRAILVSDQVGCQRDLAHDGVNGFVLPARDVASLADALRRAVASPGELVRMGRQSLRIVEDFSFDRNLAALRQALRAVLPATSE